MKKGHLPLFGVGPIYIAVIVALTVFGIGVSEMGYLPDGSIAFLRIPFVVIGVLILLLGVYFWYAAAFQARVHKNIMDNKLVTTGVYAWVRNPIYSGTMLACTGAILLEKNLCLLILPVVFWAFMTALMKNTEEKWLEDLYGEEYRAYCKKVNRCIPWFPV